MGVAMNVICWETDHVIGTIGCPQATICFDAGSGGVHLEKRS